MDKKEEHQVASKEKSQQVSEQEVIIPKENGEAEAAREQLIRLQADFDNYKKRMIKKEAEFLLRANERLLGNILPIVNDLARALEAKGIKDSDHNTLKGVKMIHDKLLQMLAKEEVEPIQAQEGDVIDNEEFVEAISAIEVEKKEQKGKIIQVIERGYIFRGKPLLRTKVIVGK